MDAVICILLSQAIQSARVPDCVELDFACDFETEWYSLRRVKGKGVSNRMSYYPNRLVDA